MAAPKKPQDHQQKTAKPKTEKITVSLGEGDAVREVPGYRITIDGIDAEFPEEALNDWEFLEDAEALQRGDASKIVSLARRLFGDGYEDLKEKFRDDVTGRVDASKLGDFVTGVLTANPNS